MLLPGIDCLIPWLSWPQLSLYTNWAIPHFITVNSENTWQLHPHLWMKRMRYSSSNHGAQFLCSRQSYFYPVPCQITDFLIMAKLQVFYPLLKTTELTLIRIKQKYTAYGFYHTTSSHTKQWWTKLQLTPFAYILYY